jgi:hypothetical protein
MTGFTLREWISTMTDADNNYCLSRSYDVDDAHLVIIFI